MAFQIFSKMEFKLFGSILSKTGQASLFEYNNILLKSNIKI